MQRSLLAFLSSTRGYQEAQKASTLYSCTMGVTSVFSLSTLQIRQTDAPNPTLWTKWNCPSFQMPPWQQAGPGSWVQSVPSATMLWLTAGGRGFFGGDRQKGTFKEGHCSIALHSGITKGTGLYWHPWTLFMVLTLTFSLWRILQNSLKSQLRRTQCISFSTRLHFIKQKDFMFILEGYKFWGNSRQFCGHHFCPVTQSFPCCSVKVQIQLLPHTNEVWTLWLGTLFCMTPACMGSSFWRVDSHSTMGAQEQRGH